MAVDIIGIVQTSVVSANFGKHRTNRRNWRGRFYRQEYRHDIELHQASFY